jgi:hypothetical protein
MKKIITAISFVLIIAVTACNSDIDFGEQYKKTVYIVNGTNLLSTHEHFYGTDNSMLISIYCASSEKITEDLYVRVKIDKYALDSLNSVGILENVDYVNRIMLPESHYRFSGEKDVVIRAGEQYGVLEIPLEVDGLDADSVYALPLSIVSNSAGYDINPEARSIVYGIKLSNKFSGEFSGMSAESPTAIRPVSVTVKAVSVNTVRLPVHNMSDKEDIDEDILDASFMMLLTVADGGLVTVAPWKNSSVVDLGGSFYDEVQQLFELHYRFTDGNNKIYTITEKITNISAPRIGQ